MPNEVVSPHQNNAAVLTSMHAKELAIGPVLRQEMGLIVVLSAGVNTDQFGTFSGEVERTGSQLDAARAKIAAGFECVPFAKVGLASEGSFGPHPYTPFLAIGRELVLMIDRENGFELSGYDVSPDTNFRHRIARDLESAFAFARRVRFPKHGLIVMGCKDEEPAPDLMLNKEVTDPAALRVAVQEALSICGDCQ